MPLTSNSPPNKKPAKGHYLQAGMFLQATNAEELKRKLEAEGLPVFVESRVQLGPFNDRKEAEQARERLKALGVQAVLVP
jgi:DedD protein